MNVWEVLFGGMGAVGVALTLIQIAPVKVNPWDFIGKKIGRVLTGEVLEKLEDQEKKIEELRKSQVEEHQERTKRDIEDRRYRIIRFADEITCKQLHSMEHYNQIIEDIRDYENYCLDHPKYKNNKALVSIKIIKGSYQKHILDKDFLDNIVFNKEEKVNAGTKCDTDNCCGVNNSIVGSEVV